MLLLLCAEDGPQLIMGLCHVYLKYITLGHKVCIVGGYKTHFSIPSDNVFIYLHILVMSLPPVWVYVKIGSLFVCFFKHI